MKDGELKTLARYTDEISARIAAGMLIENVIPAAVFGQNSSYGSLNYINPVEVKVAAEDYEDALSLLAAADKAE